MNYEDELDGTARLILMDSPQCSLRDFAQALRAELGQVVSPLEIAELWTKYRGFDGRRSPTHDVTTGGWR